jgi:cytochrome c
MRTSATRNCRANRGGFIWSCALLVTLIASGAAGGQRQASMKATQASDIARGQKIYEKSCAICHFSASAEKKIGPGMKGTMKKEKFANGWKVNEENLRRWIENGGKNMPSSHLNAEQIRELIEYLKTL